MSRRVPTLFLILGLFSLGCGTEEEKSVSPSSVASFQGGEISFAEAEAFLRREETSEPLGSELMGEYRRAAESLAVHRILLEEARDRSDDPTALEDLRRQVTLDFYFRRVLQVAPVEEAEVEAFFKEKQALFQQPEERFVWHLFRRHRDPTQPEVTLEEVEALRQRWLAGETFLHLARQYSESETRVFEGRLGRIQRGRLPPRLDEIVFALGENEISDPVKVPGGAALFFVSEAVSEKKFTLEDLRPLITRRLRELRIDAEVKAELEGTEPPEGSFVLESSELLLAASSSPPETEVLRLGRYRLTLEQLQQQVQLAMIRARWWSSRDDRMVEIYDRQVDRSLLLLALDQSKDWDEKQLEALEQRITSAERRLRLQTQLEERLYGLVDEQPAAVRAFYDDNTHAFQTSPRLKMRQITIPVRADAPKVLARLSRERLALMAGELTMEQVATKLNAPLIDHGWVDFSTLSASDPKLRTHLLSLDGRQGFTIPFQLNDGLHLIQVEEWEDPRILPFDDVEQDVRQRFFDRHQQRLYKQLAGEVLARHKFRFHEDNVQQTISPGAPELGQSRP